MTSAVFNTGGLVSDEKPSVFLLIAADSLRNTIYPAFSHALRFAAEQFPRHLHLLYWCKDEVYLAIDLILQIHHLQEHKALFSEHFYGLERKGIKIIYPSLFFDVIIPYIKRKLDATFEEIRDLDNSSGWKSTFIKVYPYIHWIYQALIFTHTYSYAIGKSNWHSPWTRFAAITIQPGNENDKDFKQPGGSKVFATVAKSFAQGITFGLEFGAFFLQFLDWWYSAEQQTCLTSLPIPNAPHQLLQKDLKKNICPLCRSAFSNPTLLSSTGITYCYTCIVKHFRQEKEPTCPVTKCHTSESALLRIYD